MNALIIGSGGREYTFGWKLAQSSLIEDIYFIPGNGGTNDIGKNIDIDPLDFDKVQAFVEKSNVELVIVGPEQPLVEGIVDYLNIHSSSKIKIVGPTKAGAMLEGSKAFAKDFMLKNNIPTAKYNVFNPNQKELAVDFLKELNAPYVLKADGLASGKGVLILDSLFEAEKELNDIFSGKFGSAGNNVVIEEFLTGIEVSVFVITDGDNYKILPTSKDYKRIGENDTGLNTGGMGAVSPVPFANEKFMAKVAQKIIKPTIEGLKNEHIKYNGFIYFGLMNVSGEPYVIEYNARMGDPETQAVLPRIKNDFADLMIAVADNKVEEVVIDIDNQTAITVVLAAGGYPGEYEKNKPINIESNESEFYLFHAGTKVLKEELLTNGGRVLAVTCFGATIEEARQNVYKFIERVHFDNMYFRKDIGVDLLNF